MHFERSTTRVTAFLAALSMSLMCKAPLSANLIEDQTNPGPIKAAYILQPGGTTAQTFTVGIAGNLELVDVSLYAFNNYPGNLNFEIVTTSSGLPYLAGQVPGSVLASGTIQVPSTSGAFLGSLSGFSIPVSVGEQLAVTLSTETPVEWYFVGDPNSYTGGEAYYTSTSLNSWYDQSADTVFSTFVTPSSSSPVPEPSSLALFLLGGVGFAVGSYLRRRPRSLAK